MNLKNRYAHINITYKSSRANTNKNKHRERNRDPDPVSLLH